MLVLLVSLEKYSFTIASVFIFFSSIAMESNSIIPVTLVLLVRLEMYILVSHQYLYFYIPNLNCTLLVTLLHYCKNASTIQHGNRKWGTHARGYPKHSHMGTARIK